MTLKPIIIRCPYCGLYESTEVLSKNHTTRTLHECFRCYDMYVIKTTNIMVTTYRLEEHEHYTIKDPSMQELFEHKTTDSINERQSKDSMLMRDDDKAG